jgi:hypothetical protein
VASFSWTCARAELRRGRLIFARGAVEEVSEAPTLNAFWMKVVECQRNAPGFRAFVGNFGFLRAAGEPAADWVALAELLAEIARPWGNPQDRSIAEMFSPGAARAAALHDARRHAQGLWRQAVDGDLEPDLTAPSRFIPKNLAGFIALQVIEALEAPPAYRRCRLCNGWFAVNRADAFFCRDQHRSLFNYREGKRRHGTH